MERVYNLFIFPSHIPLHSFKCLDRLKNQVSLEIPLDQMEIVFLG